MKKGTFVLLSLTLTAALASAQQQATRGGTIQGVVIGPEGRPAKNIGLTATPLDSVLAAVLPHTRSDDTGHYTIDAPWWARYTVYADDEQAGYSSFSTGGFGQSKPAEVEITVEHPVEEMNVYLPPRAGFIAIHLTNLETGKPIPSMSVRFTNAGKPNSLIYDMSCASDRVLLVPPDRDLLIHVSAPGFQEWGESARQGVPIRVPSGSRVEFNVALIPRVRK